MISSGKLVWEKPCATDTPRVKRPLKVQSFKSPMIAYDMFIQSPTVITLSKLKQMFNVFATVQVFFKNISILIQKKKIDNLV